MVQPILAPNSSWFTQGGTTVTRSSITEIEIVDSYTPTGNETASWDASEALDGSVMAYVTGTKLTIAGNGTGCVYANPDSEYVFSALTTDLDASGNRDFFKNVTAINGLANLDVSKATTLRNFFYEMVSITAITGVKEWDTSNVISMKGVFRRCISLTYLPEISGWNTGNVENMNSMFCGESHIGDMNLMELDLNGWDVSNVVDLGHMFYGCSKLTALDLSKWNTSKVTNLDHTFCDCFKLSVLNVVGWNTSNVQSFRAMFNDCYTIEELDLSTFDTSSALTLNQMFERCTALKTIKGLENFKTTSFENVDQGLSASEYTELGEMFLNCSSLTEIDIRGFSTPFINAAYSMFNGCSALRTIYVSQEWSDNLTIKHSTNMFTGCTNLVGGMGFKFDSAMVDATYAHIDDGAEAQGYFTEAPPLTVAVGGKALFRIAREIREVAETNVKYTPTEMIAVISEMSGADIPDIPVGDPVAKIGDTAYTSVSEALAVAQAGETVVMIADAVESNVTIPVGVKLDLRAYQLTANSVNGLPGSVITGDRYDGTLATCARLVIPKENLHLQAIPDRRTDDAGITRSWVPLWSGEYYVFGSVRYNEKSVTVTESDNGKIVVNCGYTFNSNARTLCFSNGIIPAGIYFVGIVLYYINDGFPTYEFCDGTEKLSPYIANGNTVNYSNIDCNSYTDLVFKIEFKYDCGIIETYEYTYADYVTTT